jgi:hypothetical protein
MDGWNERYVPKTGTIFPYMGRQVEVYKCPEDKIDVATAHSANLGGERSKPLYSYTGPMLLTGAPVAFLKATYYGHDFSPADADRPRRLVRLFSRRDAPWMIVEEDIERNLVNWMDSAWSASDQISDRHNGAGAVAHTDGHVSVRAYQRTPLAMTASQVVYELIDGRFVTADEWRQDIVYFGYLRDRSRAKAIEGLP